MIGVGGIMSADDATAMLDAGARLVQLYTGFIYAGPGLVRQINRRLAGRPGADYAVTSESEQSRPESRPDQTRPEGRS